MSADAPTLIGLLNLILLCVLGGITLLNRRAVRALKQEEVQAEVVIAPIEAEKRSDDMLKSMIQALDKTLVRIDRLADELHDKNNLDRRRIAQTEQQLKDTRDSVHELRSDLALTTNALTEHVKATTPAVTSIIEQKPVLAGIDQKIGTLPGAVRTEMREDFQALQMLFEGLKLQVTGVEQQALGAHQKLDIIITALQSMVDRAPSTTMPDKLPEQTDVTQKLGDTLPSVEPDPTRPGIKSPFDNGQPKEVTPQ